ncbi:hypothetical protein CLOM_g7004 [Closterium sp. NIES-68]|nr:hypothetical protein CLOM_g7004 [Closterium sp. NIES-68]
MADFIVSRVEGEGSGDMGDGEEEVEEEEEGEGEEGEEEGMRLRKWRMMRRGGRGRREVGRVEWGGGEHQAGRAWSQRAACSTFTAPLC